MILSDLLTTSYSANFGPFVENLRVPYAFLCVRGNVGVPTDLWFLLLFFLGQIKDRVISFE